ncbi:hypothetical protein BJN34_35325 (plasmid) [Cupriavidus necator]|uniref:Cyclophilin-like domain-containing protein n=1 Tax=Cupriavidus necator TaxID=106590 RepID=A0A1U9V2M2_CUPNE|nr:cyclophilin-like fold protein [Cupriavidus necator]AQV99153.1 hypothetical protein BJN34_35325 [Cupriavidus necator]
MTVISARPRGRRPVAIRTGRCGNRGPGALSGLGLLLSLLLFGACEAGPSSTSSTAAAASHTVAAARKPEASRVWISVGEHRFAITLADNAAARAFVALLPLTLDMSELNGNEKYAQLPNALPTNVSRPGTIRNGDILLYGSDTVVVFYLTFNSTYSYTPLGRIDNPLGLARALGPRSVQVVFSVD